MIESISEKTGLQLADEEERARHLTPRKLAGVGLLGALAAIGIYYAFCLLSEESKDKVRQQISSALKASLQKIAAVE